MPKRQIRLSKKKLNQNKFVKPQFPVQIAKGTAALFCSDSSEIEKGCHLVVLTCVARKCNVHRTVFLRKKITVKKAHKLLDKWIKLLPFKYLR